jgi:NAD(P)-dependent dehydrogenase (short-subunit alcohol dehydrogenase family)
MRIDAWLPVYGSRCLSICTPRAGSYSLRANRGIGRAISQQLSEHGIHVVVTARDAGHAGNANHWNGDTEGAGPRSKPYLSRSGVFGQRCWLACCIGESLVDRLVVRVVEYGGCPAVFDPLFLYQAKRSGYGAEISLPTPGHPGRDWRVEPTGPHRLPSADVVDIALEKSEAMAKTAVGAA